MRSLLAALACLSLVACGDAQTTRRASPDISLPPMKTFSTAPARPTAKSNDQIARDFIDLVFTLENGEKMQRFTRFEGPITVRVTGNASPRLGPDLERLLERV